MEDAPLEPQPPCVPSQTHRCPPQTRFCLDFPTPVEHTTIILVSQAQDCGGDFDPALFLWSPTQTACVATLRTLSLQHVSPGLLCFQSLATQASYKACGALEGTPTSLASSHVTSPGKRVFDSSKFPSSLAFLLSVFPAWNTLSYRISHARFGYVVIIN